MDAKSVNSIENALSMPMNGSICRIDKICKIQNEIHVIEYAEILAKKRREFTIEDEVVLEMLSSMTEHIVNSWEGTPITAVKYGTLTFNQDQERMLDRSVSNELSLTSVDKHRQTETAISNNEISEKESRRRKSKKRKESLLCLTTDADDKSAQEMKRKSIFRQKSAKDSSKLLPIAEMEASEQVIIAPSTTEQVDEVSDLERRQGNSSERVSQKEWKSKFPDENVIIVFTNGNRYEGQISCKLFEGEGKYTWTDGTQYQGEFEAGQITGKGIIEWPDLSWYEGEFHKGYRHGKGSYFSSSSAVTYTGQWFMGLKHGKGVLYYSENPHDYYDGDWEYNERHGEGLRCYPSGARYCGEWKNGLQHGKGTMTWPNNDVYEGGWKFGERDGYGEYVWSTFNNKFFAFPMENVYKGSWKKGVCDGYGILEVNGGGCYDGEWVNNQKHGRGTFVYRNGKRVSGDPLFVNGHMLREEYIDEIWKKFEVPSAGKRRHLRQTKSKQKATKLDLKRQLSCKSESKYKQEETLHEQNLIFTDKKVNEIKYSSVAVTDFSYHIQQWKKFKYPDQENLNSGEDSKDCIFLKHLNITANYEETSLISAISNHITFIHEVYVKYATMACKEDPEYEAALARIFLWQLLRDCGIHKILSLVELDEIFAKNENCYLKTIHYPFEIIKMWQFIHILVSLSWILFTNNYIQTEADGSDLASIFHSLIEVHLMPHIGKFCGSALSEYCNFVPINAAYAFYKELGEPHSARHFLKNIFTEKLETKIEANDNLKIINGINVVGRQREVIFIPEKPEFPYDMAFDLNSIIPKGEKVDLSIFQNIQPRSVVKCIYEICPGIKSEELLTNMDYELTFLEFYEIVILCAMKSIEKNLCEPSIKAQKLDEDEEDRKPSNISSNRQMSLGQVSIKKKKK